MSRRRGASIDPGGNGATIAGNAGCGGGPAAGRQRQLRSRSDIGAAVPCGGLGWVVRGDSDREDRCDPWAWRP